MNYEGKLYGHIGGKKYFDTGKTGKDWDKLEERLSIEERQNEMLVQECNNQRQIIDRLINALRSLYNHVDSPLEPMYEFSLKNARDLIQQYEDGFL